MSLKKAFEKYDMKVSEFELASFEMFLKLFLKKNSLINLSAIRDEQGVIEKHFIDSVILNRFLLLSGKVLDIGTGGGFPGIPLSITNPKADFTLLDSTRKKIESVNEFIKELDLKNCIGVWGRAEEFSSKDDYIEKFDFIVSRATAYLPQIVEWSEPFLKKGGKMIIYKLNNPEEIKDGENIFKKLKLKLNKIYPYTIDGQDRILIEITK